MIKPESIIIGSIATTIITFFLKYHIFEYKLLSSLVYFVLFVFGYEMLMKKKR